MCYFEPDDLYEEKLCHECVKLQKLQDSICNNIQEIMQIVYGKETINNKILDDRFTQICDLLHWKWPENFPAVIRDFKRSEIYDLEEELKTTQKVI